MATVRARTNDTEAALSHGRHLGELLERHVLMKHVLVRVVSREAVSAAAVAAQLTLLLLLLRL